MIKKKVVIKYKDSKIIKGWIESFRPTKDYVSIHPLYEYSEERQLNIKFDELKAVFFVKDFVGNKNYQKIRTFDVPKKITPSQRKIIVDFEDGEKLYGTSINFNKYTKGFFIYPIDEKDNNIRIFVLHSSVRKIHLMNIKL